VDHIRDQLNALHNCKAGKYIISMIHCSISISLYVIWSSQMSRLSGISNLVFLHDCTVLKRALHFAENPGTIGHLLPEIQGFSKQ